MSDIDVINPESEQWIEDCEWAREHFGSEPLDPGIVRVVRLLKEAGIETCQSCEGPEGMMPRLPFADGLGDGHSYRCPTVDVTYQPWAALDVANTYGIRVDRISEEFRIEQGRPVGHCWRIEFNSKQLAEFRDSWYRRDKKP